MGTQCEFACPAASASHLPPAFTELKTTRITNYEQLLLFLISCNKIIVQRILADCTYQLPIWRQIRFGFILLWFLIDFWEWNKTLKKKKRFHQKLPQTICTSLWYTKPNGLFISLLKRPPKIDPTGDILIKRPKPELTQTKESFNSSKLLGWSQWEALSMVRVHTTWLTVTG